MAESKDFNDALDEIFLGENREYKESYEEGLKAGTAAGNVEGYHLGYHRGAELGKELGHYLGIVTYHINLNETSETKYSEKILSQLTKVQDLIKGFPEDNSEAHDILGMAETIRAQYKKACALLKISSVNPYDGGTSPMLSTIKKLQHKIDSLRSYLTPLLPLANCHMVEFITQDHWETLVPEQLRKKLDGWDLNYAVEKFWECAKSPDNTELSKWITTAKGHCLTVNNEYCLSADQLRDRVTSLGGSIQPEIKITEFMTSKKSYEVSKMSALVASLYGATSSTCCVEAGGGRGHLLVALCLGYNIPSLTVDCDEGKVRAAAARISIIQKQWHAIAKRIEAGTQERLTPQKPAPHHSDAELHHSDLSLHYSNLNLNHTVKNRSDTNLHGSDTNLRRSDANLRGSDMNLHGSDTNLRGSDTNLHRSNVKLHRFATAFITKDTDLARVAAEKFPELTDIKLLLTGLHTCGDLGPASLRMFASRPSISGVFNVPCCYHLLSEGDGGHVGFPMSQYLTGYKLGRNARMLAAQSIDRVVYERQLPAKSLLYRALLQVLIKTHLPQESISEGRLKRLASKCDNFQDYFKMADAMLNLGLFDRLPQSCLKEIYNEMDCHWRKLVLFYLLRLCLAQVVESVILLDRLLFLLENGFDRVFLVKLFDPVLSPRCHAIVAVR